MTPVQPTRPAASTTLRSASISSASPSRMPCARVSIASRPISATGMGYLGSFFCSTSAIGAESATAMLSV